MLTTLRPTRRPIGNRRRRLTHRTSVALSVAVLSLGHCLAAAPTTPIQHVIVVIGENQTFDTVFATYVPPPGESVRNLLAEGIIGPDGSPGPEYSRATQSRAAPQGHYAIDLPRAMAYQYLPQPTLIGVLNRDLRLAGNGPDPRFPRDLPPGPFQVTRFVPLPTSASHLTFAIAVENLGSATGDPVHRFFQMWQQTGGDNARLDLYAWVPLTTGMGGDTVGVTPANTGQGGEVMGFLNISAGDAPLFRDLARRYAMSDNYHQSIMGGTGANFFALATADEAFFNVNGKAAMPPLNQIEDPDPQPETENFYRRDGYSGGSYVECADRAQPGVAPILERLERLGVPSGCEPGHYYLVNNYSPGYDVDGHRQPLGPNNYNYPPQTVRTIAEALAARGVTWGWYTGAREAADVREEVRTLHLTVEQARRVQYNDIGDPLVASRAVSTRRELRSHLKGLASFAADLRNGRLPAVSFVVPKNLDSGHPGNSVLASFEDFLSNIIAEVQAHPGIWAHTAIIATTDEGGGHFDSGYIQTLDFFGDGPRIPLLVISPYARPGHIDHVYADHASILKFIEHNWRLRPLTARSRDRLPNPVGSPRDAYRPLNQPAVGDLMTLFEF
jgi:acid phosphatase